MRKTSYHHIHRASDCLYLWTKSLESPSTALHREEVVVTVKALYEIRKGHRIVGLTNDKWTADEFERGGYDVVLYIEQEREGV